MIGDVGLVGLTRSEIFVGRPRLVDRRSCRDRPGVAKRLVRLGADEVAPRVAAALPAMLGELEQSYGIGNPTIAADDGGMTEAERAWGLAPPREYAAILSATVEKDYRPRFAARGVVMNT